MMVGGRNIRHTHSWWHSGNWRDREIRALQPVNPGQDMAAKAYSNCGWITWHSGAFLQASLGGMADMGCRKN